MFMDQKYRILIEFFFLFYLNIFQTLQAMAALNNGKVICPRTKETYDLTQAEKVYIMQRKKKKHRR